MLGAAAGAAAVVTGATGAAPSFWAAANVKAAVAKSQTTVRASRRGTNELIALVSSARSRGNSSPSSGEVDDLAGGAVGARRASDDREDRVGGRVRLNGVQPAERRARKGLEPG